MDGSELMLGNEEMSQALPPNQWLHILQPSTVTEVINLANIYDKGHLGFLDGFPAGPHPPIRIKLP